MTIVFLLAASMFLLIPWIISRIQYDDRAHAGEPWEKSLTRNQIRALRLQSLITTQRDCFITDTSKWDAAINYIKMRSAGISGTILKCGQGNGIDPWFYVNWGLAKFAGFKRGSYWFYDSRVEPTKQALAWWNAIKNDVGELPHFADYEEEYGGIYGGINAFTTFLIEFQRLSQLPDEKIGVYTAFYYWASHGSLDSFFRRYWLWLAWYGDSTLVIIPKPWTENELMMWQYTATADGSLFGVSARELDLSYFVFGKARFTEMFGELPDISFPEREIGMFDVWSNTFAMTLRSGAFKGDNAVGSVPIGTHMIADVIAPPTSGGLPTDKWAHVIEIGGVTKDVWVAVIHNGVTYCQTSIIIPTESTNPRVDVRFVDENGKEFTATGIELLPK